MASLQWVALGAVVAFEAILLLLISLPLHRKVRTWLIPTLRPVLQPMLAVIPFALFQLLGLPLALLPPSALPHCHSRAHPRLSLENEHPAQRSAPAEVYWKFERKARCVGINCTARDRDRYEKSIVKYQRNLLLAISAAFLYWLLWSWFKASMHILLLEQEVKKLKQT